MISVIIPVYNVEDYLRNALESLLNQTFKDFEVILVMMVQQIHQVLFVKVMHVDIKFLCLS